MKFFVGYLNFSKVGKMIDDTSKFKSEVTALADELKQVQAGFGGGTSNSQTVAKLH
ncbi:hypothetical protein [Carnobacterium sp.]|uniref:hypothetical protein n=1 Tax=Carnobacterium sp. TaxID=48221 RepID=UPI0028AF4003|nr:hypothetical protein [Carnobacterium sp.]